jgi:hypothetical protein
MNKLSRAFTSAATWQFDREDFCASVVAGGGRNPFAACGVMGFAEHRRIAEAGSVTIEISGTRMG